METIGQRLKKVRESKKLSLEKVNKDTKIHSRILAALENDKIDEVMSPVYARNFLKTYAQYLGLDAKALVDEYTAMHPVMPEPIVDLEKTKKKEPRASFEKIKSFYPIFISVFVIILVIVVLFISVGSIKFIKSHIKFAKRMEAPPKVEIKKDIKEAPKKFFIPQNEPLTLTIKTKDDVWLQVKSDGRVIFENILPKRSTESWRANSEFNLWAGKADALELTLNGHPLNSPGKGVIKNISVTRNGLQIKSR